MKSSLKYIWTAALVLSLNSITGAQEPVVNKAEYEAKIANAEKPKPVKDEKAKIVWHDYEAGLAKAKKEKKPIVIDFTASWCGWCKRMDRDTFAKSNVIDYLNENFIAIKVWGDAKTPVKHEGERMTEQALTKLYGVRGFPTFWFLDANGGRIGPSSGYKKPAQFLPLVEYVAGNHYRSMSYDAYLKNKDGKG